MCFLLFVYLFGYFESCHFQDGRLKHRTNGYSFCVHVGSIEIDKVASKGSVLDEYYITDCIRFVLCYRTKFVKKILRIRIVFRMGYKKGRRVCLKV